MPYQKRPRIHASVEAWGSEGPNTLCKILQVGTTPVSHQKGRAKAECKRQESFAKQEQAWAQIFEELFRNSDITLRSPKAALDSEPLVPAPQTSSDLDYKLAVFQTKPPNSHPGDPEVGLGHCSE